MSSNKVKPAGDGALLLMFHRFPNRREIIKELFYTNASFRSLCEALRDCMRGLRYWKESGSEMAPARQAEYTDLMDEIEQEILAYLKVGD